MIISPSIQILIDKIENYFARFDIDNLYFLGRENRDRNNEDVLDVFLFGDFYYHISELQYILNTYDTRLWCLCPVFKQILNQIYGIKSYYINTLDRYNLFPIPLTDKLSKKDKKPPSFQDISPDAIVLSGRFTELKNSFLALDYAVFLQSQLWDDIQIIVSIPENCSESKNNLNLVAEPNITKLFRGEDWIDSIKEISQNPLFINFSTSFYEDFTVTNTQIEQEGFYMLLSYWGAHIDLKSSSIYYLKVDDFDSREISKIFADNDYKVISNSLHVNKKGDLMISFNKKINLQLLYTHYKQQDKVFKPLYSILSSRSMH